MKLVRIKMNEDSPTKSIPLDDIKYWNGNALELPPDPENNLVIDPRPVWFDREGYTFEIKLQQENSESLVLMITRTDKNQGWDDDIHFRVYDRTKEDVPTAFDSSLPYDYWGLDEERAPYDATVVKVHGTVTTIKKLAFRGCDKMTTCDMSDAPVEEIEEYAFYQCTSLRNVSFSHSLRKIGTGAFYMCSAIECLIIPPTVTNIDEYAFSGCESIRILRLPSSINLDNVHNDIIYECDALLAKVPPNKEPKQWLKDRYEKHPLHDICYSANVTFEEIEQCVEDHPKAVRLTDEFGNTFLHYLARNPFTNADAIESLCHSDIDDKEYLVQKADEDGCTALHYLASNRCASAEAIKILHDTYPSAATMKDKDGRFPLHYAVQNEGLVERGFGHVHFLAQGDGGEDEGLYPAQIADEDGRTALHYLARNRCATGEALEGLYHTYPSAATMKDKHGKCPLHDAVQNEGLVKRGFVDLLFLAQGEGGGGNGGVYPAQISDEDGRTALHYLARDKCATGEALEGLYDTYPGAATMKDKDGKCPLHYAVLNEGLVKRGFVDVLFLAQGEIGGGDGGINPAQIADEDGCTALHLLVMEEYATAEAIESLYNTYPGAATMKDKDGKCPLYYAVLNEELVERGFVDVLFLARGEVEGGDGGINPAQIADKYGCTALHYLASNRCATAEALEGLYDAFPGAAAMKDKDGNSPLHVISMTACATTKKDVVRALALARNENGEYAASILDQDGNTATALAMRNASATDDIRAVIYSIWPISRTEFKDSEDRQRFENAIDKYIDDFQNNVAKKVEEGETIGTEKFGFVRHICHYLDSNSGDDLKYIKKWASFFGDTVNCPLPQLKIIAEWKAGREKVSEYAAPAIKEAIKERLAFLTRYDLVKGPVIHRSDTAIVVKAYDLKSTEFYKEKFTAFFNNDPAREQGLDRTQFRALVEQMGGVNDDELDVEFDRFDQSKDGYMQCDEFIKFCSEFFDGGQSRVVALKFMSNADQFDKELEFRKSNGEDLSRVVVAVEHADDEIMEDEFQKVRHAISATEDDLPLYKMVLVMPYGDRNLDSIYRFEQPGMNRVRSYIEEISTALSQLHSDRNVCHGDLAMRNIVRFNGSLRLIDMDASANIPTDDQYDGSHYVGLKFSSGILPPEMIAKLDEVGFQKYEAYFADEAKEETSNYWKKIEPKKDRKRKVWYGVRTFKATKKDEDAEGETFLEVVDKTALPYDLILASEAIDLWSLGILLYSLIKGQSLFDVDRNDDLKSVQAFKELFSWSDSTKTRKLNDIEDVVARDLLKKLLSRDPSDRGPLNEILDHVFFKTGKMGLDVDAELKEIKESQKRMEMNHAKQMKQLRKIDEITRHISWSIVDESRKLRNTVFEATEVKVPTCFIISPHIAEDDEKIDAKVIEFFGKINDCAKCITDFSADNLMKVANHFTGNKTETYALNLIDEHTRDKLEPPYTVKLSENDLADYVPIMLNGLRIFSVANKFVEVVKSIIPLTGVLPTASEDDLKKIGESIEALSPSNPETITEADKSGESQKSRVAKVVKSVEDSTPASQDTLKKIEKNIKKLNPSNSEIITDAAKSGEIQNFRGAKLRKFEKFLLEEDNKQGLDFCGLRRVCDSDGNAIWVTEDSYKIIIENHGNNELDKMRRQRDAALAEKKTAVANKEAALADKEAAVADKEAAVADKEAAVADKEAVAAAIAKKDAEMEASIATAVAAAIAEKEEKNKWWGFCK